MNALKTGNLTYAIVKHHTNEHSGSIPDFTFKLHKTHKTSLERQIKEALLIEHTDNKSLMNSKSEWGFNSIPRVRIEAQNNTNSPANTSSTSGRKQFNPELSLTFKRSNDNISQNSSRKRARPDPGDGEQLPVQQIGVTSDPLHASSLHALTRVERIGKVMTKCDIQPNDIAQSLKKDTHSMFQRKNDNHQSTPGMRKAWLVRKVRKKSKISTSI